MIFTMSISTRVEPRMIKNENLCVGCETCTLGSACPLLNATTYECDVCGQEAAYRIEEYDLCSECAHKYLDEQFGGLPLTEKAEAMGLELNML